MTYEQLSLFTDEELGIKPNYDLIGLTGYAGSGKDTFAKVLVEKYGYTRIAFADPIRELLYKLNPIINGLPYGGTRSLSELVDSVGWDEAKKEPEVRRLLQDLGVGAREVIDSELWVSTAFKKTGEPGKRYVITDVRFTNEADLVKQLGGQVWRVKRVDVNAVNGHISENEMDGYKVDQIFLNNGTIDELEALIKTRMQDVNAKSA